MTVQEWIPVLRLIEKQKRNPIYMKQLGASINIEHRVNSYKNKEGGKNK